MVFNDNQQRIEKDGGKLMVVTNVFEDTDSTQYLVTVFDNGYVHFAIKDAGSSRWNPPLQPIRVERTETN